METGLFAFAADGPFYLFHKLRVGEMAGTSGPYAALDAFAQQGEVAQQVEELVAGQFVVETELQVVQVAARDADILFVENFLEMFELIVRDGILHDDDRVVQVAALDQVHLHQRFQIVQEDKGAAGGDLRGVIVFGVECRILVADHLGVVVHVQRYGKFVVGVKDDGHAFFRNRIDHFFGDVVVGAFGFLMLQAGFDDCFRIFFGRTVHDRSFTGIDIDRGVVHAQGPEGRHDMFDGRNACAILFDGRTPRGIRDIVAQGRNFGFAFQVDAAENDAAVLRGGMYRHRHFDAGVEACT